MSKRKTSVSRSNQPHPRLRLPKEIWAAIILGGLGLLGVLITSFTEYLSATAPIEATRTAEFIGRINSTAAPVLPTLPIPITPTPFQVEQSPVLSVQRIQDCHARIIPSALSPTSDIDQIVDEFSKPLNNDYSLDWAYAPEYLINSDGDSFWGLNIDFILTNTASDKNQTILLRSPVQVFAEYKQEITQDVNIVTGGCGGRILINEFTPFRLDLTKSDEKMYTTKSVEFDGLTVDPGQVEIVRVPVICEKQGIYKLNFQFNYWFSMQPYSINYDQVVWCPVNTTFWQAAFEPNGLYNIDSFIKDVHQGAGKP